MKDFPKWPAVAILGNGLFFLIIHIGIPGMTYIIMDNDGVSFNYVLGLSIMEERRVLGNTADIIYLE